MKKQLHFNVSLDYQFFSGAPDAQRLAKQLHEVLAQAVSNNLLNAPKEYNGESVISVAPVEGNYTAVEMDAVLCVFDEITSLAHSTAAPNAMVADLKETHENGGTPALRQLAMSLGKIIESVWAELTIFGFNDRWEGAWDFEFIPALLGTIHANNGEFPTDNYAAWLNAALSVLEVEQDEYNLKKLVHNNPELAKHLGEAARHFKAARDLVGADVLSKYSVTPSPKILAELDNLAGEFSADQV